MPLNKSKRNINLSVLSGEPTDGSGRICIHLFVESEEGSFIEPHVLIPAVRDGNQVKELSSKSAKGGIACDLKRPSRKVSGNTISVTTRTDDPRAVTCPKCKETAIFKELMQRNS